MHAFKTVKALDLLLARLQSVNLLLVSAITLSHTYMYLDISSDLDEPAHLTSDQS